MAYSFTNLDETIRRLMLEEVEEDVNARTLYISTRLKQGKQQEYELLLRKAIKSQNEVWLAQQIRVRELLKDAEEKKTRKGVLTTAKVPTTAADTLAEGEYNRFYIRGVCIYAIRNNIQQVEVYRGKEVSQPRTESQNKIGTKLSARKLLDDLRSHPGVDTALGLPSGPNSGLTVKLLTN